MVDFSSTSRTGGVLERISDRPFHWGAARHVLATATEQFNLSIAIGLPRNTTNCKGASNYTVLIDVLGEIIMNFPIWANLIQAIADLLPRHKQPTATAWEIPLLMIAGRKRLAKSSKNVSYISVHYR
jgi:hypothetical protein